MKSRVTFSLGISLLLLFSGAGALTYFAAASPTPQNTAQAESASQSRYRIVPIRKSTPPQPEIPGRWRLSGAVSGGSYVLKPISESAPSVSACCCNFLPLVQR